MRRSETPRQSRFLAPELSLVAMRVRAGAGIDCSSAWVPSFKIVFFNARKADSCTVHVQALKLNVLSVCIFGCARNEQSTIRNPLQEPIP